MNSFFGFSQILSGVIFDETLKKPLPYANITLLNKNLGVTSNEQGEYSFNIKSNTADTLLISYLGYSTKKISLISFQDKKEIVLNIALVESKEEIDGVVLRVKKKKYTSPKTIGETKKKRFRVGTQFGYENCVFIENVKRNKGKLKAIKFSLKENVESDFNTLPTYYRIKFYKYNTEKRQPGMLLSYKDIFIKPKNKTQNISIDLSEHYVLFPLEGVCVGIETVKPSSVKLPKNPMYTTAPSLVWTHNSKSNTWSSYRGKKWVKNSRKSAFKKKFYRNPLIQLKVQYRK